MTARSTGLLLAMPLLVGMATSSRADVVGGGSTTGCFLTFRGLDATDRKRQRDVISCEDGAPCDADGAANGSCNFAFTACAHQETDGCTPATVVKYKRRKQGKLRSVLDLPPPPVATAMCGGESSVTVKRRKPGQPLPRLTILAKGDDGRVDRNVLAFECRPSGCPPNPAGGPGSMTFNIQTEGSDLDSGWTGVAHGFPVPPARVTVCLSNCDGSTDSICDGQAATGPGTLNGNTLGPPIPLLTTGVPVCLLNRYRGDLSGISADVRTGAFDGVIPLTTGIFVTRTDKVCPRCIDKVCDSGGNEGGRCEPDAELTVSQGTGSKKYQLSRDCPPGGFPANLQIDLKLTTGTDSRTSADCDVTNLGPCKVAYRPQPQGCGSCTAPCTLGGASCVNLISDPNNPGATICQDSKRGTSQVCCENDPTQPCFPDVLTRSGVPAAPVDDGTGTRTATEVFAGTFCVPGSGTCTVDGLTGLPGLGAVILPVETSWK